MEGTVDPELVLLDVVVAGDGLDGTVLAAAVVLLPADFEAAPELEAGLLAELLSVFTSLIEADVGTED